MNKEFPTKKIESAWLAEICPDNSVGGIKNILGIEVRHNGKAFFYSIFDDCYFRVLPLFNLPIEKFRDYHNEIFASLYSASPLATAGKKLYQAVGKETITKEEIIANKDIMGVHLNDLIYDVNLDTYVDYEDESLIDDNTATTVEGYMELKGRPITFNPNHIYGPGRCKKRGSINDEQ